MFLLYWGVGLWTSPSGFFSFTSIYLIIVFLCIHYCASVYFDDVEKQISETKRIDPILTKGAVSLARRHGRLEVFSRISLLLKGKR